MASPLLLASKGHFDLKVLGPPGSPLMPQGGPFLGSSGAKSLRTGSVPLCTANTPACGIFYSALCGPCLPLNGLSGSSGDGASSLRLCMPSLRASHSGVLSTSVSFCDGSSGGLQCLGPSSGGFHSPTCRFNAGNAFNGNRGGVCV